MILKNHYLYIRRTRSGHLKTEPGPAQRNCTRIKIVRIKLQSDFEPCSESKIDFHKVVLIIHLELFRVHI